MTWVRLDDAVMSHPKMLTLDPLSFSLWVGGLAYANRHATDGVIPEKALWGLVPGAWKLATRALTNAAKTIVDASLWTRTETGWSIVNYSNYQEEALSERVEERREANKQHKRAQREREKQRESGLGHALTHADSQVNVRSDKALTVRSDVSVSQGLTHSTLSEDSRANGASSCAQDASKEMSKGNASDEQGASKGNATTKKGAVNMPFLQGNMAMSEGPVPSRPVPSNREEKESPPPQLKTVGQGLIERTQATRALLEQGFKSRGLKVPPCLHDRVPYSKEAQAIAESVPLAELPTLIENFFANAWAAKRSFNVALIVDNPNEYMGTINPRQVRANSEYRDRTAEETAALWNQGRTA